MLPDNTFSREDILAAHPLLAECERRGMTFKKVGSELTATCPFHQDGKRGNFRLNEQKQTWFCDVCDFGGSVVDYVSRLEGKSANDLFRDWARELAGGTPFTPPPAAPPNGSREVATYDYRDESGDLVYQVVRYEPKTFRQRHMVDGKWAWNMEGVTRVLYRLPEVLKSSKVWVCYDPETEVLTPTGWVKITDPVDCVAQYHAETGAIDFTKPKARTDLEYEGPMIAICSKSANLLVTPDHRMLVRKKGKRDWQRPAVVKAWEVRHHWQIPSAGFLHHPSEMTPEKARLVAAWQADGLVTNTHRTKKNGDPNAWHHPAFNLKKNRKKERIRKLLSDCGISWKESSYPSSPEWTLFTIRRDDFKWMESHVRGDNFRWSALEWGLKSRQQFCEELAFWDGDHVGNRGIRFFTSSRQSADLVCAVAALSGYSAKLRVSHRNREAETKDEHVVSLVRGATWREREKDAITVPYKGSVHCLTVDSGFLVVRRHGTVSIAGNCEGEKDCDNLKELGITATCNVGGAGKWLDGYTESLKGKDVVLCGDNDEPGRRHMEKILVSIRDYVKSVKLVRVPSPHKDASDWIGTFSTPLDAAEAFVRLEAKAPVIGGFYALPVKGMEELEAEYCQYVKQSESTGLDLGKWLPSLRGRIRPLVPGELAMFIADTGTGKTALLQNMAFKSGITTLLFELELPGTLTFERFLSIASSLECRHIEEGYRAEGAGKISFNKLRHVWVCDKSGLTIADMKKLIQASALKIGKPPSLVLVDYVQLVRGEGKTRYERTSSVAEDLKVLAKELNVIVVAASQIGRKQDGSIEIGLHDAKNAGEIENSSGLVIGAWRDPETPETMHLRILKNTKGGSGTEILCNFKTSTMQITEQSPIDEADVPKLPYRDP